MKDRLSAKTAVRKEKLFQDVAGELEKVRDGERASDGNTRDRR